jgi:flagellin
MKRHLVLLAMTVSLLLVQSAGAASLLTNGGFETGDLSGWSYSGDPNWFGFDVDTPNSGKYYAYFGEPGAMGLLSQSITTIPNTYYNVSFWMWSYGVPGDVSNQFQLKWDGKVAFDQTDILGDFPVVYTQYQFTVLASSTSTLLELGMRNDPYYIYLDDISVKPVPIPGAVLLLGSGLVGLAGLRRKFKS